MDKDKSMASRLPKRLWPLASCCSMTLGLYLLSFLLFPDYYPAIHDRIADGNLTHEVAFTGLICVLCPIALLYLMTSQRIGDN